MKIAVGCDGTNVTHHFGFCESFRIYDCRDKKIVSCESFANPGHKPGFLPALLAEKGAEVIIAGSMGEHATAIFKKKNIDVIVGATGDAKEAAEKYLAGNLKSTEAVCHDHEHEDECHHHDHE